VNASRHALGLLCSLSLVVGLPGQSPTTQPEPPRPEPGTVRLTSRPEGAEVWSISATEPKLLGTTPLELSGQGPGVVFYRVQKERHTRKTVDLFLRPGARAELDVELQYDPEPRPGEAFTNGQEVRMPWVPAIGGWAASVETSQAVYTAVVGSNPSQHPGPDLPVTDVSCTEAAKFCELLTITERGLGFLPPGYSYRLPSDEEWSALASGLDLIPATAPPGPRPDGAFPVGSREADRSPLGLSDLLGNVREWCRDDYTGEVLRRELVSLGSGQPEKAGNRLKVIRGGTWNRPVDRTRAVHGREAAEGGSHRDHETGFRVVLVPVP